MTLDPVIEEVGTLATESTISLVSVQLFDCTTVSRSVAEADETCAVVTSDEGESIRAEPLTTLQVVDASGCKPAEACPGCTSFGRGQRSRWGRFEGCTESGR